MAKFRKTRSKNVMAKLAWTLTKLNLSGTNELHFYGWHEAATRIHEMRIREFKRATKQKRSSR